ncbi:bifunctional chorismate mutase/prephenate dehydrogenase [Candidatus Pacearchaeota archaeon]|nr:bifunctional chorismate mutase/prephenate dehydrogenase [Candidatus Pacearchaeota archaeon]
MKTEITCELSNLRKKIDNIDEGLLNLLDKRIKAVRSIGNFKEKNNLPIIDNSRETNVLNKTDKTVNPIAIRSIFKKIIKESRNIQHNKSLKIGIIGFGAMTQFMVSFLKQKAEIFVSDIKDKSKLAEKLGVKFVSVQEAAKKDIVILAPPVNQLKQCMLEIKDLLNPGALLLDVCSVKVKPINIMLKLAPNNVEIIGTHPLFGPQSGKNTIKGLKIVLCPVRTTRLDQIKEFLQSFDLEVIICTPEKHDKEMAKTQSLAHLIGKALVNLDINEGEITTPSFSHLINLKENLKQDRPELFNCIQNDNPFAKKIRNNFFNELDKINKQTKKR